MCRNLRLDKYFFLSPQCDRLDHFQNCKSQTIFTVWEKFWLIWSLPNTLLTLSQPYLIYLFFSGANFVFSIYDFEGNGTVDAVNLGDMLRALNLNPTLASVEKLGGTKKKNEKKLKVDEFLPIFSQCKKEKEQGNFDDFLECLKLYDKEENGKMMAAELSHTLLSLGEWTI